MSPEVNDGTRAPTKHLPSSRDDEYMKFPAPTAWMNFSRTYIMVIWMVFEITGQSHNS